MTVDLKGLPADAAQLDVDAGSVTLVLDDGVYPLDALYGAAYIFIDRAYVLLDKPAPGRFRVTLAAKHGNAGADVLRALAGEFANELLSCAWRHEITQRNRAAIEAVTMQAIAGAMGPPSLEELEKFDFTEEPFEDPLGIAVSWEEKYKKKTKDAPAEGAGPKKAEKAEAP